MLRPFVTAESDQLRSHLTAIVESSDDAISSTDCRGIITTWNAGAQRLYGYTAEEAIGQPVAMLAPDGQVDPFSGLMQRLLRGEHVKHHEMVRQAKDGRRLDVSVNASPLTEGRGRIGGAMMVERDVTRLADIAAALADHKRMQEISTRLIHSDDVQTLFRDLVDAAIEITQADGGTLESREDTSDLCLLEARNVDPKLREAFARVGPDANTSCAYALRRGERVMVDYASDDEVAGTTEARAHRQAGVRTAQSTPLVARSGRVVGMLSTHWTRPHQLTERQADLLDMLARQAADLIERTGTEQALRDSERRYRTLFESIDEGFCILEMLFDETQKPVDQRFLEINPAFTRHTGITDAVGKTAREVIPDLEEDWFETYGRVALTGEPIRFTHRSEAMDRWFDVYAFRVGKPEARKVALLFTDVTRQKQSESERERALAEVRAEQERLGEVFHYAPSFMSILRGPDHVFERANDLYMQLVGKRDLIGRPVREVLPRSKHRGISRSSIAFTAQASRMWARTCASPCIASRREARQRRKIAGSTSCTSRCATRTDRSRAFSCRAWT